MKCPKCQEALKQRGKSDTDEFGFVVVDVCPKCEGVWLDKGELGRLNHSLWVDIDEHEFRKVSEERRRIDCPRCDVTTRPVSPSSLKQLVIDHCPGCDGFWLDRGELKRLRDLADVISRGMIAQQRIEIALAKKRESEQEELEFDIWPYLVMLMNND